MFRFTTRDLLWLMVVVGLASGWWNAENKKQTQYDQALRALEAENTELLDEQRKLTKERDSAVQEAKRNRDINRGGMFGPRNSD